MECMHVCLSSFKRMFITKFIYGVIEYSETKPRSSKPSITNLLIYHNNGIIDEVAIACLHTYFETKKYYVW